MNIREPKGRAKSKPSGLHTGDKVVMHTCVESKSCHGKVWTVVSEPWEICDCEVVKLEGKSGGFSTEYLKKVELGEVK
jgi:hypothetical protein